jgi:hypothetical protein
MSEEKKEAGPTQDVVSEVPVSDAPRKREYKDFGHEKEAPTRAYLLSSTCVPTDAHRLFFTCRCPCRYGQGENQTENLFYV